MHRLMWSLAAVVALVGGGAAVAAQVSDEGNTYTACLTAGGAINKVAIGDEPAAACREDQVQISWSEGVPPEEVSALADRVASLEARTQPLELSVDCAAGETVSDALRQAQDHFGKVEIDVSGVCEESIEVTSDDVTIRGAQRTDGFRAPQADTWPVVGIDGADRVRLENLTVTGGSAGINVSQANVRMVDITVRDTSEVGINPGDGASVVVHNSAILDNARFGVDAQAESVITLEDTQVSGSGETGLFAGVGGASIVVGNSEISGNTVGAGVNLGGELRLSGTTVANNSDEGVVAGGGNVVIDGDTRISGNSTGIFAGEGGRIDIQAGAIVIEDNRADGVTIAEGSGLAADEDLIVQGNAGNGIKAEDLSTVRVLGGIIAGNGGWGISCDGPPPIAVLGGQGIFNPDDIDFHGNASGPTNCQSN